MQLRVCIIFVAFLGTTFAAQIFGGSNENANAYNNLHHQGSMNGGLNHTEQHNIGNDTKGNNNYCKEIINAYNRDMAKFAITTIIIAAVLIVSAISWVVVGLTGYHKWNWTALATLLVFLFGPFGFCCAIAMGTRGQKRAKIGYYPGQARPT
uniref:Transmembrane protein n=1 Tax=Plectus sambesii TaxID=2011161 RepID=A0A914X2R3_9BILA